MRHAFPLLTDLRRPFQCRPLWNDARDLLDRDSGHGLWLSRGNLATVGLPCQPSDQLATCADPNLSIPRRAGIVAPLITGSLLAVSPSLPLWTSAGFFLASVGATVLLPFERAEDVERSSGGGDYRKVEAS
jgi:hypothetical protein